MTDPTRAFRLWGCTGFVVSLAVAFALTTRQDVSAVTQAVIAVAGVVTFFAVAWVTRLVSGRETLTYYHHEIAILAVAALVAWIAGAPVLAQLDITALGLGTFLAFGRIGCLTVGCCHGRPARRGVRYGAAHVAAGFPAYLRDVRLLPVQAIESAAAAAIVVVGALLVVGDGDAGRAFVFYVGTYALVRFALEELRGDAARRYWRGLSEAQWTSLALIAVDCLMAVAGALPARGFAVAQAVIAAGGCVAVAARRRRATTDPLDPRHVRELSSAARSLTASRPGPILVWETSAGVRISSGQVGVTRHVTFSRAPVALSREDAARIARVIGDGELVAGPAATFHLVQPL